MAEDEVARLAREVAAGMDTPQLATETDLALEGTTSKGPLSFIAGANLLVQSARLILQLWNMSKDPGDLLVKLEESAPETVVTNTDAHSTVEVEEELRQEILKSLVDKVEPDFRAKLVSRLERDESRLSADWLPRAGGTAVVTLKPFADMKYWWLHEPLPWTPSGRAKGFEPITVPQGFVTDLASIPTEWQWLVSPTGRHGNIPAIVHDWLYWDQKTTRKTADRVFDAAMEQLETGTYLRRLIYASVRIFGGEYWKENTFLKAGGEKRILAKVPADASMTWDVWRRKPGVF